MNPRFLNISANKDREAPGVTKPEVDIETLTNIDAQTLDDSFVYVHCSFRNKWENMLIRIWKTTFLVDSLSGTRSKLIHAENISMAPVWTQIPDGGEYSFLLIFSGLPKSCLQFDLLEDIPEPGGFFIQNISRNETDVYHINVSG
ncbi:MAG: hypothetical protein WD824_06805 [Cyclobacteriaceae bacterium]